MVYLVITDAIISTPMDVAMGWSSIMITLMILSLCSEFVKLYQCYIFSHIFIIRYYKSSLTVALTYIGDAFYISTIPLGIRAARTFFRISFEVPLIFFNMTLPVEFAIKRRS